MPDLTGLLKGRAPLTTLNFSSAGLADSDGATHLSTVTIDAWKIKCERESQQYIRWGKCPSISLLSILSINPTHSHFTSPCKSSTLRFLAMTSAGPCTLLSRTFYSPLSRRMSRAALPYSQKRLSSQSRHPFLQVSEEVQDALQTGKPVVALETTIYTHGTSQKLAQCSLI